MVFSSVFAAFPPFSTSTHSLCTTFSACTLAQALGQGQHLRARRGWACGQAQRIYNPPIPCRGLVGSTPTRSAQKQPHKDQIAIHLLYVVRTAYYTASVHQIRAFCVNLSASQFCRKNGIATSGILLCERNTNRVPIAIHDVL